MGRQWRKRVTSVAFSDQEALATVLASRYIDLEHCRILHDLINA